VCNSIVPPRIYLYFFFLAGSSPFTPFGRTFRYETARRTIQSRPFNRTFRYGSAAARNPWRFPTFHMNRTFRYALGLNTPTGTGKDQTTFPRTFVSIFTRVSIFSSYFRATQLVLPGSSHRTIKYPSAALRVVLNVPSCRRHRGFRYKTTYFQGLYLYKYYKCVQDIHLIHFAPT